MNESHRSKTALLALIASCAFGVTSRVHAEDQTTLGPLEIIVPWGTGGGADRRS